MSEDRGETWKKISPDLTTNDPKKQLQAESGGLSADNSGAENHCTVFTINESPLDANVLWAGTDDGNVQVTFDGGKSWQNVTANITGVPKNTWVYFIEPGHKDKNTCYVVFDGHTRGDMKPYVMKTTDGGKTWKSVVNDQVPVFARSIKEDPVNTDILYLGTEFGLYISIDAGANWIKFENNMPAVAIHYMTIHQPTHSLVMATHGRGIIIIDDLTPLRAVTKSIMQEELVFVEMMPTVISESTMFQSFPSAGEYVGENPPTESRIVYFMNKRHTFGKMTMEIFDEHGVKVADLAPGKSKGLNEVLWNYTLKPPKTAKGKTFTFGGFAAPTVPAGKYTVKITKGPKEYISQLELKYDEASIHSAEDRKMHDEVSMELYAMMEDLAAEVEKVDMMQQTAEAVVHDIQDKKLAKKLGISGVISELSGLRDEMVVTKGDNYVGSAEPRIREKLSNLYGEVVGYAGKPTGAQMENLNLMKSKISEAKTKIENVRKKTEEINGMLQKAGIAKRILATDPGRA